MIDFIVAYLTVGWLASATCSAYFLVREGDGYEMEDHIRVIPLWPVLIIGLLAMLVMKMIEWGLDD